MTRLLWVTFSVLVLFCASCERSSKAPELPQSISPGWQLQSMRETSHGKAWEGIYSGPGRARVRIWAIRGSADGLDRVQRWHAEANTVVVYSDRYFAAVDWAGVDRVRAGSLVRAVERVIGRQPETR